MRYLKKIFETEDSFDFSEEDIKDLFSDWQDEGFRVSVTFGKRLYQFNHIDSKLTDQEIKLGFKLSISVDLRTNQIRVDQFMRTDTYMTLLGNLQHQLNHYDLEINKIYSTVNDITMLIYTK